MTEPASHPLRILFHHMPKTAGTTFCRYVRSFYPLIRRCKAKTDKHARKTNISRYHVFNGHFSPQLIWELFPDLYWVTLLRDPVKRVVSQYENWNDRARRDLYWRFWLKRDPSAAEAMSIAENSSLEEFLESDNLNIRDAVYNYQTRYLSPMTEYDPVYDQRLLTDAKKNLVEKFLFFGLAEKLDESVRMFAFQFSIAPPSGSMRKVNVTRHKERSHVTEKALARIRELNRMDMALSEFAGTEFHHRFELMENTQRQDSTTE